MGLFGKKKVTEALLSIPEGVNLDIVGESHYQKALERMCGKKNQDGYRVPVDVTLKREPKNKHDKNAVMCLVNSTLVGYINRDGAYALQSFLLEMEKRKLAVQLPAEIRGGWKRGKKDEGDFGVKILWEG